MLNKRSPRPQGLDGMADAIKEEWHKIDDVDLLTLIDSNVSHGETAQDRDSAREPCGVEDLL